MAEKWLASPVSPSDLLTVFRLEAEQLYRAQLERLAASTPASWCGLNPGLLGQLHLPPATGNRNISTTTATSGQAGRRRKTPTTTAAQQHHQQQSGNGEAPPMMSHSLWQEGLSKYQSSSSHLVLLGDRITTCDISSSRASHLKLYTIRIFLIFLWLAANLRNYFSNSRYLCEAGVLCSDQIMYFSVFFTM